MMQSFLCLFHNVIPLPIQFVTHDLNYEIIVLISLYVWSTFVVSNNESEFHINNPIIYKFTENINGIFDHYSPYRTSIAAVYYFRVELQVCHTAFIRQKKNRHY